MPTSSLAPQELSPTGLDPNTPRPLLLPTADYPPLEPTAESCPHPRLCPPHRPPPPFARRSLGSSPLAPGSGGDPRSPPHLIDPRGGLAPLQPAASCPAEDAGRRLPEQGSCQQPAPMEGGESRQAPWSPQQRHLESEKRQRGLWDTGGLDRGWGEKERGRESSCPLTWPGTGSGACSRVVLLGTRPRVSVHLSHPSVLPVSAEKPLCLLQSHW